MPPSSQPQCRGGLDLLRGWGQKGLERRRKRDEGGGHEGLATPWAECPQRPAPVRLFATASRLSGQGTAGTPASGGTREPENAVGKRGSPGAAPATPSPSQALPAPSPTAGAEPMIPPQPLCGLSTGFREEIAVVESSSFLHYLVWKSHCGAAHSSRLPELRRRLFFFKGNCQKSLFYKVKLKLKSLWQQHLRWERSKTHQLHCQHEEIFASNLMAILWFKCFICKTRHRTVRARDSSSPGQSERCLCRQGTSSSLPARASSQPRHGGERAQTRPRTSTSSEGISHRKLWLRPEQSTPASP